MGEDVAWAPISGGKADLRRGRPVGQELPQACGRGVAGDRGRTACEHRRGDEGWRILASGGLAVDTVVTGDQRPNPQLMLDPTRAHPDGEKLSARDAPELPAHEFPNRFLGRI